MASDSATVSEFRKKFDIVIKDSELSTTFDERDVARLNDSDKYVMCFVHWRKGDVAAAVDLAVAVLKWRKEKAINDITTDNLTLELLQRGVIFCHGKATDNTRLVYFITRLQTKEIKQEVQQILCLWLERLHHQETGKHVTFILDVSKAGMNNVDLGGIKFLLECFTMYFPNMLERIIILEMPWIMNAVWKIVKQWMTEEQRKRTVFCNFKDLKQYVNENNILSYMGGKDTWVYSYPFPSDEIPSLEQQTVYDDATNGEQLPEECKSVDCSENEEEYVVDDVEIKSTEVIPPSGSPPIEDSKSKIDTDNASKCETELFVDLSSSQNNVLKDTQLQPNNVNDVHEVDNSSFESSRVKTEHTEVDSVDDDAKLGKGGKLTKPLFRVQPIKRNMSNEVNLRSLLKMSPITEVVFQHDSKSSKSGRYHSAITLTNPNSEGEVAFKVKTNSPKRYYVKPSAGFINAGETTTVSLHLIAGQEDAVSKDRFLVLYQKKEENCNVVEFWENHAAKAARYEHRVRVRFDDTSMQSRDDESGKQSVLSSRKQEAPLATDELKTLSNQLSQLKSEVKSTERNIDWFRTRFKHFIILQFVIIIILAYITYKLSYMSVLPSAKLGQFGCESSPENQPSR